MIFPTVPQDRWFSTAIPWVQDIIHKTGLPLQPGQMLINLPRHPSQLYEMLMEGVILFFVLYFLSKLRNKPRRGVIISTFLFGYGICRFISEFFREPDAHIGYLFGGWLTMGISLSLPMILLGLAGIIFFKIKKENNELWG
jgi:phosphatidylglycerol:prolipoprotein diacylglycerol transferase